MQNNESGLINFEFHIKNVSDDEVFTSKLIRPD